MSLKSREARKLAAAGIAAAAALGAASAPANAAVVPPKTLKYTCKYPLVDKQPLSILVTSNIPSQAKVNELQPAFVVNATATAGGNTSQAITTLNAQAIQGVSQATASLHFPSGFVQEDLIVDLNVDKWVRPAGPVPNPLVLTASGSTPAVVLDEVGETDIVLDKISLNLQALKADGTPINVKKLTTDFDGNPVPPDTTPNDFDVYCKLDAGESNIIATICVSADGTGTCGIGPVNGAPGAVAGLKVDAKDASSVTLSWNPSTDPNGDPVSYNVYKDGVKVDTITGTTYKASGLTASKEYTFDIEATDGKADGTAAKTQIKATTDAAPNGAPSKVAGLKADAKTDTTVDLSWTAATDPEGDAISYNVYKDGTKVDTVTGTSYKATGLTGATKYAFTVEAVDAAHATNTKSDALEVTTDPTVVPDTTPPSTPQQADGQDGDIGTTTLIVRWTVSVDNEGGSGLDYYEVESEGGEITKVPAGTNFLKFEGLGQDSEYFFTVRAVDKAGNVSEDSDVILLITDKEQPNNAAPSKVAGLAVDSKSQTNIKLKWDASTDANGDPVSYNVYKDGEKVATVTGTSYDATGLTANTDYTFDVEATDGKADGTAAKTSITAKTDPIVVVNHAPAKVAGLAVDSKSTSNIKLKWDASADQDGDAVSYNVYKGGVKVATVTGTSYDATGLTADTSYTFDVEATDGKADGTAAKTSITEKTDKVVEPVNVAPTKVAGLAVDSKSQTNIKLKWTASTDANGDAVSYNVYKGGVKVATVTGTSYDATGLTADTSYTFDVEATDGKADGTAAKTSITEKTDKVVEPVNVAPTKVAGLAVDSKSETNIKLKWNASTDANGDAVSYNVYKGGVKVATVTGTSYDATGLTANTSYTFDIEATDGKANGTAAKTSITAKTDGPVVGQAPVVKSIIGKTAFAKIGGIALVSGSNFGGVKSVTVGGKNASATPLGNTVLLVVLPPLAKGKYDLVVTTGAGSSATSASTKITYISLF